MRYFSLAACVAVLLVLPRCWAAKGPDTAAVPHVMALDTKYPESSIAIKYFKNDRDLTAYLSNPDTVCTVFLPTNKAMTDWTHWFGKYVGKAAQNVTFMRSALNFHVVPGVALEARQIGEPSRMMTRANETLYAWRDTQDKPHVYSRRDFPQVLNRTDIRAGNCLVHTINMAMVPPTSTPMVEAWLVEIGTRPKSAPESQWAPAQQPLPNSLEAKGAAGSSGATPTGGARPSSSGAARNTAPLAVQVAAGVAAGAVWLLLA